MTAPNALEHLFAPRSIAVVGASANPDKLGFAVVKNIIDGGYEGAIHLVNPREKRILGLPCVADAAELPAGLDVAIIVLPAEKIPGVLRIVAQKKARAAVLPAGGFAETGAEGAALQDEVRAICEAYPIRVLGPNVPGFINAEAHLVATIAGGTASDGPLAIVSQAGSVAYLVARSFLADGIRFGHFICIGNQIDVSETDVIEFLGARPEVKAISLYVESVKDGRRFLEVARRVSRRTPILALKGGRTPAGQGAIFSHTASISSADRIYRAAFRKAGVVAAPSLRALGTLGFALAHQRPRAGGRIAIVTSLAGVGVIAADACEQAGLAVPPPSPATEEKLRAILPPMGSVRNPIDLTGDVSPDMLARTVAVLAASAEYDGILPIVMGVPGSAEFGNAAYARALRPALEAAIAHGKSVAVSWVMDEAEGREIAAVRALLQPAGLPVVTMPEDAVEVLRGLAAYAEAHAREVEAPREPRPREAERLLADHLARGRAVLTEHDCKALFASAGLPVAASRLATSAAEAEHLAEGIGFPVAMKVVSPDATHKSDIGGVELNVASGAAARAAYEALAGRFAARGSGALEGVSVQPMIAEKGVELICGVATDPQFGKYLMVGLGGVSAEIYGDAAVRLLPVAPADVSAMLGELKAAALLDAFRGRPAIDRAAAVDFIVRFAHLAEAAAVEEMEVNPLLATPRGVWALDGRARLVAERHEKDRA